MDPVFHLLTLKSCSVLVERFGWLCGSFASKEVLISRASTFFNFFPVVFRMLFLFIWFTALCFFLMREVVYEGSGWSSASSFVLLFLRWHSAVGFSKFVRWVFEFWFWDFWSNLMGRSSWWIQRSRFFYERLHCLCFLFPRKTNFVILSRRKLASFRFFSSDLYPHCTSRGIKSM